MTKLIGNTKKIVEFTKDIFIICIGLMVSSFGTALFYQAGMGSSAMATLCDGLHNILNISYGTANMVANIVLLAVLCFCDKKMINIGTVLCVFLIGIFVDLGNIFWGMFPIADMNSGVRFLCVIAGCVMMGSGLGLYVAVERGFGALEGLVKYICRQSGLSFDKVKVGQDILLVVIGIFLQADWGIGTVVSALIVGSIMRISIDYFQKILKKSKYHPIGLI